LKSGIALTAKQAQDYNDAIRGGDKEAGDTLTAAEAKLYNATLPGALKANTVLLESEVNAYNTAIRNRAIVGVKKQMGDMLTATEAAAYNATLPGSSTGEIYESAGLFSLMIFEGDGVFQLLPSCSEIKETSLGIQFATGGRTS
jgi:hypothetical protein